MKNRTITIKHSVFINKPRTMVWDYTQDYDKRSQWDKSVKSASVLQYEPQRIVQLKLAGNISMVFLYKLDERPHKTSLAAKEIQSFLISSGGGSWLYEEQNGGTCWTQTNTLVLRDNLVAALLAPLFRWLFRLQTKKAMNTAKRIMEQ